MADFPKTLPVGQLREVLPDIFFVTGQTASESDAGPMCYSRNMTVVRDGSDLTILNSVRLDDSGLRALDDLGTVRHIVRLGSNHGRDDAFYLDRYEAGFWAISGMELNRDEKISRELVGGSPGPCNGSTVFTFETVNEPEAILRLDRLGGVLITCDSLQNFNEPNEFFNETAIEFMQAAGFFNPANIGPGWLHKAEPKPEDFGRLKQLAYRHVFSAHGDPRLDDADQRYKATFASLMGV
ncbi:MAG: hypothetical protein AAF393_10430 [Pseudomonadota bacterium]